MNREQNVYKWTAVYKHQTNVTQYATKSVVTSACETWIMKKQIEHNALSFERKILRKIFGPNNLINGCWEN